MLNRLRHFDWAAVVVATVTFMVVRVLAQMAW